MATPQQNELTCPVCEHRFRPRAVLSTNAFRGERTDLGERAAGTQPVPSAVHTCDRCGCSVAWRGLGEEAKVGPAPTEQAGGDPALEPASGGPTHEVPEPVGEHESITHGAFMRVQAELMPRGAEFAWIEQHSAAYRAWVESFARVSDDGRPTIAEATLRTLAREHFFTASKQPGRPRFAPARTGDSPIAALDRSLLEAARTLDLDDVRSALSLGAKPGAVGPGGNTALHYLASGRSMVAAVLFEEVAEAGGDVRQRNEAGVMPADIVRDTGTAAMKAALARTEQRGRSFFVRA